MKIKVLLASLVVVSVGCKKLSVNTGSTIKSDALEEKVRQNTPPISETGTQAPKFSNEEPLVQQGPLPELNEKVPISSSQEGDVERFDLGFGQLSVKTVPLPGDHLNAKEVYQLAHYIGRTDSEQDEEHIDIPIRSYQAACLTGSGSPRLFVSTSLAMDASHDNTLGSVYELAYNPDTESFERTGNSALLPICYESHGVAVSEDCSRIAVLCNTEYQTSERFEVTKDLVEPYGSTYMKMEDNHAAIDNRLENDLPLMLVTNHKKYKGFFLSHDTLIIEPFLAGLKQRFPEKGFNDKTTFNDLGGREMEAPMAYILDHLSSEDLAALKNHIRSISYKGNDQIWLLEWNNQSLSEVPDTYVVNKMHGGTHLGIQELIYVESDSLNRESYGFSVTARVFDGNGGSHYSAGLTIVDRHDWKIDVKSDERRGWYWLCGDGHVANIRAFYNPYNEMYGAVCTSDWNDWIGNTHGQLGTIAIKMEDAGSSVSEGRAQYFVPSTAAMITNGGGHSVVPVDEITNLSVIVAPKLVADDDMNRFLVNEVGVDLSMPGPYDEACANYDLNNCFFSYITYNRWANSPDYPSVPRQGLYSGDLLAESSLTRIGIGRVSAKGAIEGQGYRWVVEDDDCQISDPQLVDLKNGRYLLGYAKFQCISDELSYNRSYSKRGANRMLIPKSYYLLEVDAEGNALTDAVQLPNVGWGGLDELVSLGEGKVGWLYITNPTIDGYGGGQQKRWNLLVYESAYLKTAE